MTQPPLGNFPTEERKEFLLAAMRVARMRIQLLGLEVEEIGISLKFNMINAEGAVTWLDYIGALHFINVEPWTNKIGVDA